MSEKTYIGDNVYASIERGMVKIETETFEGRVHEIFLEPEVIADLVAFAFRAGCERAIRVGLERGKQSLDGERRT